MSLSGLEALLKNYFASIVNTRAALVLKSKSGGRWLLDSGELRAELGCLGQSAADRLAAVADQALLMPRAKSSLCPRTAQLLFGASELLKSAARVWILP